jgi:hypothetical protein
MDSIVVRARQLLSLRGVLVRKTFLQVDAGHLAALGNQPEHDRAHGVADCGLQGQRERGVPQQITFNGETYPYLRVQSFFCSICITSITLTSPPMNGDRR